jgi:hypothetical protein
MEGQIGGFNVNKNLPMLRQYSHSNGNAMSNKGWTTQIEAQILRIEGWWRPATYTDLA